MKEDILGHIYVLGDFDFDVRILPLICSENIIIILWHTPLYQHQLGSKSSGKKKKHSEVFSKATTATLT